jgi:hypothetical protein
MTCHTLTVSSAFTGDVNLIFFVVPQNDVVLGREVIVDVGQACIRVLERLQSQFWSCKHIFFCYGFKSNLKHNGQNFNIL